MAAACVIWVRSVQDPDSNSEYQRSPLASATTYGLPFSSMAGFGLENSRMLESATQLVRFWGDDQLLPSYDTICTSPARVFASSHALGILEEMKEINAMPDPATMVGCSPRNPDEKTSVGPVH